MEYFIKSSAILIIFYVSYKLLIQKETFFQNIRFYLLTGLFASLILPLITIPEYVTVEVMNLPINVTSIKAGQSTPEPTITRQQVLMIVYLTGVAFFLFRFLFQLVSVIHFINSHKKNKSGKYYLIKTQKNISPFSFFNLIVINDANYSKNELEQILNHEKIHVKQYHSFDILLTQINTIIFWFNPFSWLYAKEIRKNLEFIADESAQYFVKEKKTYQYLLLKTSSPDIQWALTSNFYNSLIKKRIDMLQKERSQKFMQLKFALVLPFLFAFIFTFNTKVIAQKKEGYTVKTFTDRVDIYEFIAKDTKDDELKEMKENLEREGVQFKYKKLKRNNKGEITGISITVKNKAGNEAKISQSSNLPISPIMIHNSDNGELSIGNVSKKDEALYKMHLSYKNNDKITPGNTIQSNSFTTNDDGDTHVYFFNSDTSSVSQNNFVILSDKKGKKKEYVVTVTSDDDSEFVKSGDQDTKIWVTKGGDSAKVKTIKIISDDDSEFVKSGDQDMKIWVTKGGDSTKVKTIKIISDNDKQNNIEIDDEVITIKKGDHSKDGNVFIFKSDDKINASSDKHKMIYSTSGKKPLFLLNGKKISEKEMNDIKPEQIESINVLKGKTAIDKYGEKAKDGVIEITTKK